MRSLSLVFVLVLSVVGCGGEGDAPDGGNTSIAPGVYRGSLYCHDEPCEPFVDAARAERLVIGDDGATLCGPTAPVTLHHVGGNAFVTYANEHATEFTTDLETGEDVPAGTVTGLRLELARVGDVQVRGTLTMTRSGVVFYADATLDPAAGGCD